MNSVQKYKNAANDILEGIRKNNVWFAMSSEDLRSRYRRTAFGVLWLTATFSLFILAKSMVFGGIMAVPFKEYTLYMATSFLIWGFLSATVTDACTVWINSESWLCGINTPKSIFVFQVIFRNFVTMSYSGIALIAIFLLLRQGLTWHALMVIPALLLTLINAVWITLFLGVIATRYRDIVHVVRTGMGILFFVTPILWIPSTMSHKFQLFALYNPFAHALAIVRDPLVYGSSASISWLVCGSIAIIGWTVSFLLFAKFRTRIVFWF
ncbi:MAG: ABC transporter permease [Robiginitomaculum sp.]